MTPKTMVIIHGHFYQPPRENPWTGSIEEQESASPYHDWNQRVTAECYTPNTSSRVLDPQGRVLDVVNNFEHFSYNFGPTLLSYLEEQHPDTYRRILQADKRSEKTRGFGNAIAQGYNHTILPLCSPRDRWTQIVWGLADFENRFQRKASGLWLPEAAVNQATLEDLARAKVQFILLAPSQAEAISPLGKDQWEDVSPGSIPTHRPYLCRTEAGDIQVLFYHADLSRGVAFEHLLRHAGGFADRIAQAASACPDDCAERLVFICSDGESYGHHEPMGDMCMAYLSTRELPARGFEMTNPTAFLNLHPPQWEVRLKPGENQQGTSWSCPHGVDRWQKDCGCSTGGMPGWNQAWRAPLRHGLDSLRETLDPLFERLGMRYLKDPWKAREDAIKIFWGKPLGSTANFFATHARKSLNDEERAQVFRLLEMQRQAMLMYTSCGWFFTDLSGIETLQNLKYAYRASQLGEMLALRPVDRGLRENLEIAKSNLPSMGSGNELVRRYVLPSMLSPEKLTAHCAILLLLDGLDTDSRIFNFRIQLHSREQKRQNGFDALCARMTLMAERTREGGTFDVAVLLGTNLRLRAFVRRYDENQKLPTPAELLLGVENDGLEETGHKLDKAFGHSFGLSDMLVQLREKTVLQLLQPLLRELSAEAERIFQSNEPLLQTLASFGIRLPQELHQVAQLAGNERFNLLIERDLHDDRLDRAMKFVNLLESLGVTLDKRQASRLASQRLQQLLEKIIQKPESKSIDNFIRLLDNGRSIKLELTESRLQEQLARALEAALAKLLTAKRPGGAAKDIAGKLLHLAGWLNLNTDKFQ